MNVRAERMATRARLGRVRVGWFVGLAAGALLLAAGLDWFAGDRARREALPTAGARGSVAEAARTPPGPESDGRVSEAAESGAASPGSAARARLRLVASEDGEPVVGAELQVVGPGGELLRARSDAAGSVDLPVAGPLLLLVRADGRQRVWGVLRLGPGEHRTVSLAGGASLRLAFVSETGAPVHGVDVHLIPPDDRTESDAIPGRAEHAAGDLARAVRDASIGLRAIVPAPSEVWDSLVRVDDAFRARVLDALDVEGRPEGLFRLGRLPLRATTGDDGLILWDDLAEGEGWRWRVTSRHSVEPEPPFHSVAADPSGSYLVRTGVDDRTSGPFVLQPGAELFLTVLTYTDTGVRGRLESLAGVALREAEVRVFDVRFYRPAGNPEGLDAPGVPDEEPQGLRHYAIEHALAVGPDGAFEVHGVSPGDKRLVARWREGDAMAFAVRRFQLEPGVLHDLGSIGPLAGDPLHVSLGIVDSFGAPLSIEDVFEPGASPSCSVILADREGVPEAYRIGTTFELELGRGVDVYGLHSGGWDLHVSATGGWRLLPEWLIDTRWPKFEADVPGTAAIAVTLMESHELQLALSSAVVERLPRLRLFIERTEGRQATLGSWSVRPAPEAEASAGHRETLNLPAGTYQLVVVTDPAFEVPAGQGVWGAAWIDIPHAGAIPIELHAGVDVAGLAVDERGVPWAGRALSFFDRGWRISERVEAHAYATTDEYGRFVLRGLRPGAVLEEFGTGVTCRLPDRPGLHEVRLALPESDF